MPMITPQSMVRAKEWMTPPPKMTSAGLKILIMFIIALTNVLVTLFYLVPGVILKKMDKAKEAQIVLSVPSAAGDGPHARTFHYEFEVVDAATGAVVAVRRTLQEMVYYSEAQALERKGWCAFAKYELPQGMPLRFRVTPCNAAGRRGRPLESSECIVKGGTL